MKSPSLIPVIVIPVLAIITGLLIIPAFVDARELNKDCDEQSIIINNTEGSVYISCIPAKDGTITGNQTVVYVD